MLNTEVLSSSPVHFPGCLLLQSRKWMGLLENQDGPGSSFLYIFPIFFPFLKILSHFHTGRITFCSRRYFCLPPCAFFTTRFQVLNWIPERVSLWSIYIYRYFASNNLWLAIFFSGSSWTVWKEIDHPSNRLIDSASKTSCDPPVPLMSSCSSSWPSSIQQCLPVWPFSSHPLLAS